MSDTQTIDKMVSQPYKYGFVTDIEYDYFPKGLNEDVVKAIWEIRKEPEFMLEFRLKAYRNWLKMVEPKHWANLKIHAVFL